MVVLLAAALWAAAEEPVTIGPRPNASAKAQAADAVAEHLAHHRVTEALAAASEWTAREPGSARAQGALAAALFRNSRYEEAEAAARRALERDPECVDALLALARCLDTRGRDDEQLALLEKAVAIAPRHPEAHRLLAGALDTNEKRERIRTLLKEYLGLNEPGPRGRLFTEHAGKLVKLLDALKGTEVDLQPPYAQRPRRAKLRLGITEKEPTIRLRIGGAERRFLFDTGEESLTLTAATAQALGARKIAELPASTATGIVPMDIVLVERFDVGEVRLRNVLAGIGSDDILGPNLLHGYRVKMDFAKRELLLTLNDEDAAPGAQDLERGQDEPKGVRKVRFRRHGGMVWVPIGTPDPPQVLKQRSAWGFLDTGADPPALLMPAYLAALKSEPGKGPLALPFKSSLGGAAGEGEEQLMQLLPEFKLRILDRDVNAAKSLCVPSLTSLNEATEAELDAIVGWPVILRAFKSMEIDLDRCVLTVEPK